MSAWRNPAISIDHTIWIGSCCTAGMLRSLLVLTTLSSLFAAAGCATAEAPEETQGSSSEAQARGADPLQAACGRHRQPNSACSAELFVTQLARKAGANSVDAIGAAGDATKCLGNLVSIGAVSASSGPGAPVVLVGAAVLKGIETIQACGSFAMYLSDVGIVENLQCFFQRDFSTPAYEACACTYVCTRQGISVRRENAGPRERAVNTKFDYGYVDDSGECQCTDDASEARR